VSADVTYLADFTPPGPNDFEFPSLFGNQTGELGQLLTKSSFLLVLAAVVVAAYFLISTRKLQLVPGKGQFVLESSYNFVRDSIGRDIIGTRDFLRWVPLLVSLFFFILVNNLFGMFPVLQFPSFSRVGFAYGLAILVWVIYNGVGIAKHGFFGYLKHTTVPVGVGGAILPLIVLLEFFSNIIVRPITLSLRLFANMFAGHLLIILFATGAEYLLIDAAGIVNHIAGVLSFVLGVLVGFLELLVEFLQAFVFTLLTATYIGGALSEEH
jgi:F-type H+-transporting ATPase subunit a